jgi:hypothetical protein
MQLDTGVLLISLLFLIYNILKGILSYFIENYLE